MEYFFKWKASLLFLLCIISSHAFSDEATDLAKESQNPVANLISVPFNNNFNFGFMPQNHTQYILDIKPVIPISLTPNWNLITRTILPIMYQPNILPLQNDVIGIGDLNPSFFLSPAISSPIIYGIGPTLSLPTASHQQLGSRQLSVGPTFVALVMPKSWVMGFLTSNIWSVEERANRPAVNFFSFQYFINYNFPRGWFLTSAPTLTAHWNAIEHNRWTVPFGIGFGRVFKIEKQAVNASIQAYDNVVSPRIGGAKWQLQLNVSLLFPEKD